MSFDEIAKLLVKDFVKEEISFEKLQSLLENVDQGHYFFKKWMGDRKNFQKLKNNSAFNGHISDSVGRKWLENHCFPVTLEILNKVIAPGGEVSVHSFGGKKRDLLVYYALCPELENFVTLICWIDTKSSEKAWVAISDLISNKDDKRVLQFSNKCGILLPNRIHPSHDKNPTLVTKEFYESLYDWRFAHYLFDDSKTIVSHNSPLNLRRMILNEWDKNESIAEIRTTIGRLVKINRDSVDVSIPSIYGGPMTRNFKIDTNLKEKIKENSLYYFQVFKIVGHNNMEIHIRNISDASSIDIVGMFLASSAYLLHLGNVRLNILDASKFEKLFKLYYDQAARFCNHNNDELDAMNHLDWKQIQFGFTNSFTRWIDSKLYVIPPLLNRFLCKFETETQDAIIKQFDKSLISKANPCFTEIPYNSHDNRMFSRKEMAEVNRFYDYVNFLIHEKRFLLQIEQNFEHPHQRDEQISWLRNIVNSN